MRKLTRGDFFGVCILTIIILGDRDLRKLPTHCDSQKQELLRHRKVEKEGLQRGYRALPRPVRETEGAL